MSGIFLTYKNKAFFLRGNIHDVIRIEVIRRFKIDIRNKTSGWKFDRYNGYFTTNIVSASPLRGIADESAKKLLNKAFLRVSRWRGPLTHPDDLKLLPHQPGAIRFLLSRDKSYLGARPGLGKTPIAAVVCGTLKKRAIVICPPFLQMNTLEEFQKWAPHLHTKIIDNIDWEVPDILIIPDSILHRHDVKKYVWFFRPQVFIVDEVHRFKELTTQRTKALIGYKDNKVHLNVSGLVDCSSVEKLIYMSGTPMPSRPIELYSIISKSAGEFINFMTYNQFGIKYCGGELKRNKYNGAVYGYDFSGVNEVELKKLASRLVTKDPKNTSAFMLRMDKDTIDLPPLTQELVLLGEKMPKKLETLDIGLLRKFSPNDLMKKFIAFEEGKDDEDKLHLATYRRVLGNHKVKPASDYIKSVLEETDENIIIFGVHKEVISLLAESLKLYKPLVVTGDTPTKHRHQIVKEYQNNKARRVFIGNIDAVGVGFTLTKAHRIFMVEWSWVTGVNRQAIDRVHRITLSHPIVAQYLAFKNSIDRIMFETLNRKERITNII